MVGVAMARRVPKMLYKDYNSYVYLGFWGVPIFLCARIGALWH